MITFTRFVFVCSASERWIADQNPVRTIQVQLTFTYISPSPYIWWQYVGLLWFLKFHTMNKRMEKSVHDYPNCWNRIRSLFKFFLTLLKFKTLIVKVLVGKKCDNHNCTFFTFLSSVNYNIIWERIQCTYLPTGSFGG